MKKAIKRLEEYLDSECDNYDLEYNYTFDHDRERFVVEIKRNGKSCYIVLKYEPLIDELSIELIDNCFYVTKEYDYTVKYFWMLIAPALF